MREGDRSAGSADLLPPYLRTLDEARDQAMEVDPVAHIVLDLDGNLTVTNAQARQLLGLNPADVGHRLQAVLELAVEASLGVEAREVVAVHELVQLFEAWGPADPATVAGRQRLSSLLFA